MGANDVPPSHNRGEHFNHPVMGRLDLLFENTDLAANPGMGSS
jgi:hypothetical protein